MSIFWAVNRLGVPIQKRATENKESMPNQKFARHGELPVRTLDSGYGGFDGSGPPYCRKDHWLGSRLRPEPPIRTILDNARLRAASFCCVFAQLKQMQVARFLCTTCSKYIRPLCMLCGLSKMFPGRYSMSFDG